jgi:hypothetical protein
MLLCSQEMASALQDPTHFDELVGSRNCQLGAPPGPSLASATAESQQQHY